MPFARVVAAAVVSLFLVGGPAPVRADAAGWVSFCGTLQDIRALSETPPTAPDPTRGRQGLERLARLYGELLRESPSGRVERLLRAVRPVLGHGATTTRPTDAQRRAVRALDRILLARCDESTANVFKIGIG